MSVRVIRKLRLLFDVVFTRPDASPVQDGDVVTYVAAQDKFFVAEPVTGGGGPPTGPAGGVLSGTYPNPGFAADMATQAELDAHVNDATDAHDASAISNVPAGGIAGTDVQTALNELDTEKATPTQIATAVSNSEAGQVRDGDAAGGVLSGTYPNPGFAVDMATQAELDAIASASVNDGDAAGGVLSGTYPNPGFAADMATQAELDAHVNDVSDAHDASAISIADVANDFTATDVEGALAELQSDAEADAQALTDHLADPSAAHAASAVSVNSTTLSGTGTDVQASLEEIDNLLDDHSGRHENGGADEINVAGLSGELADAQPVTVRKNTGADVGTRSRLNFIEGSNVTLTVADDAGGDEVDITITSSGSGGGSSFAHDFMFMGGG